MRIRAARPDDTGALIRLIAEFRAEFARLRATPAETNPGKAEQELADYQQRGFPIFVAEGDGASIVAYLVCRVDGDVVWAESLFVSPECRRGGIASALYAEAERLARERGAETVYNWIHPDNGPIVSFLRKRGYNVLNLIEVRRPSPGERIAGRITVGEHEFDY